MPSGFGKSDSIQEEQDLLDRKRKTQDALDDVDFYVQSCLQTHATLNKLQFSRVRPGVYRLLKKDFEFKLLPRGAGLGVKMFVGFILFESLVHFEEELLAISK